MANLKASNQKQPSFNKIVSTYTSRFGQDDDQGTVTEAQRQRRQETATEGTDQYYNFATTAYENGWGEHFHYCPFAPGEPILQAMAFYEHRFAYLMGLKPGMKVLDIGCGIGGPAREIAKFIGCEIVGITINQRQVNRARELTRETGLEDKCVFLRGDFLNLPFPDCSFDAAYAIEATVHAPSLTAVYKGIARILKPGAVFGLSEWVMTPSYDPRNPKHIGIRNRIERGNAISNLQTSEKCRQSMNAAGFIIEHDEDYALHWKSLGARSAAPSIPDFQNLGPCQLPQLDTISTTGPKTPIYRPWFYPLAGQTQHCATWTDWRIAVRMTPWARRLCYAFIWVLEHIGLFRGTLAAMTTMAYCVDSVVEGGKEGCFTPCWWFIGRKGHGEGVAEQTVPGAVTADAQQEENEGIQINAGGKWKDFEGQEEVLVQKQDF